jgi:capsular polysaccharide biosynthesis protein
MSEQALDLRGSLRIAGRHKTVLGIAAGLGLLAGTAYAAVHPPLLTSSALVILAPATRDVSTQVVIADSIPVLSHAMPGIHPPMSLSHLHNAIQVKNPTPNIISISAEGRTAPAAENIANTVARSYVAYVSGASSTPQAAQARVLESATSATGRSLPVDALLMGGAGALAAAAIALIGVLALRRSDRRLRERDEIASAIGVPVLASVPVGHPANAGQWIELLEDYRPSVLHAWQMHTALSYLGQAVATHPDGSNGDSLSIAVVSPPGDRGALALGPQLATFAASQGIATSLVIGPVRDANTASALRAACTEPPPPVKRPQLLRLAVSDGSRETHLPGTRLTVIVAVADSQSTAAAGTLPASATVIGVSAGAVTATQLVRVAMSAAAGNRQIDGILVADPDPDDRTTGRVPRLTRPSWRRMPTRLTQISSETRR